MFMTLSKANAQVHAYGSTFSNVQTELAINTIAQTSNKKVLTNIPDMDIPKRGKIEVFDATGKRLPLSKNISIQSIKKLPVGIYFLKVTCLTGTWTIEIKEQD